VQTFHEPPSLRPHYSSLSIVSHPRARTKLHPGKGIPNQAKGSWTTGKTQSHVLTQLTTYNPSFPTCLVPPQEVCPFSSQHSLGYPTSLLRLQQQAEQDVSEPCSCSLAPSGNQFPNNSLI
jgi:hypothetical protein